MKKVKYEREKLAKKVTGRIALGLVVVFSVLIVIITMSIRRDLVKREQDKLTLLATENASIAREFMESMLDKQSVLINAIKSLKTIEEQQKVETLGQIISSMKKEEKNALSVFYIAEPNALSANTPNGYSIFATAQGLKTEAGQFQYVNQELYERVKKSKQMTVVDPFKKTIDGKDYMVITVVIPILNEQEEVVGVVGSNIDTALLNSADYNKGGFESFSMEIICGHQTMIANSKRAELIGKAYIEASDSKNAEKILETAKNTVTLNLLDTGTDGEKYYKSYVPFYIKGSSVVWLSGSSIAKSEFDEQILKQSTSIAIWLLVGLVVLTLIAYFRLKSSLKPICTLENAVEELAKGNLQCEIEFTSDDELGALADSLRQSMKTLSQYVKDIDRAMEEMANGNFDLKPSQPFVGDFQNIEVSISTFIVKMSSTLQYMKGAAQQVSMAAEQVAQGSQALAESTEEEANSVDVLSAELLEVSTRTKTNETSAMNVNALASVVSEKIFTSNKRMHEMSNAMLKISQSSEEIGEIIKTLEDISVQTNMLALNVAIEAARAGAAGKSFAVVAEEVRKLASKSSEAAQQTSILITDSIQSVKNGVIIAQETAESLSEVVSGAADITKLIEEISEASKEQSNSITEITDEIEQILISVQTNSATSEESAAASEELSSQAEGMRSLVSKFKLHSQVNSFDIE